MVKVLGNWLPRWVLFKYDCFLYADGLCSAIPLSKLIIVHSFALYSFFPNFTHLNLTFCREAIDVLINIKGKPTKGKRRHMEML